MFSWLVLGFFLCSEKHKDVLAEHLLVMNSASALDYRECAQDHAEVNENYISQEAKSMALPFCFGHLAIMKIWLQQIPMHKMSVFQKQHERNLFWRQKCLKANYEVGNL